MYLNEQFLTVFEKYGFKIDRYTHFRDSEQDNWQPRLIGVLNKPGHDIALPREYWLTIRMTLKSYEVELRYPNHATISLIQGQAFTSCQDIESILLSNLIFQDLFLKFARPDYL